MTLGHIIQLLQLWAYLMSGVATVQTVLSYLNHRLGNYNKKKLDNLTDNIAGNLKSKFVTMEDFDAFKIKQFAIQSRSDKRLDAIWDEFTKKYPDTKYPEIKTKKDD